MKLFFAGLACAIAGFIAWFAMSVLLGIGKGVTGKELTAAEWSYVAVPWLIMVGGPVVFWLVIPVFRLVRRIVRRGRRSEGSGQG